MISIILIKLTNCNNVAEETKCSLIIRCTLDMGTSGKQVDTNRDTITDGEENDTRTTECVVCGNRTKVETSKCNLNNHTEHHGVEWETKLGVDLLPQYGTRNCTISGKSPGASRCCCGASNTAEQTKDDERNGQGKGSTLVTDGGCENDRDRLCAGQKGGNVRQDIEQWDEENDTSNKVEADGSNDSFGNLMCGISDFLTHAAKA